MPPKKLHHRVVDADHPWLGLESFTEATRMYFFGRDAEIADIYVRTRENALTILYGQSGLGKTSLLGAGLIPKLKLEHCQPILIRLRYEKAEAPLLEQVKNVLAAAIFSPRLQDSPYPEATLWELFHHMTIRPANATDAPAVLIFDQFEEIFTLGQRAERVDQVRALFTELADVIENRPPSALKQRFTEVRELVREYDFAPAPLRVVITLREDYLSHLEQWERTLPSLMRNRMALQLLSGPQALQAVFRPGQMEGRHLVDEDTAARIVRFVANRAPDVPLADIGAVPPLLSLVCDELNTQRIEQNKDRITAERVGTRLAEGKAAREEAAEEDDDLLVRSRVILAQFYQRSFTGIPAGVQHFVEDRMVTVAGHRCPVSRDDAVAALVRCRVKDPAETLQSLVNRRLISSEERNGVPWFEITHDVLVPVIKVSKDKRLARQRLRRMLAASAAMLALLGVLSGITAWALKSKQEALKSQREALLSEHKAQEEQHRAVTAEISAKQSAGEALAAKEQALQAEAKAKASLAQTQETLEKLKAADAEQEALLLKASHGDHEAALRAFSKHRNQESLAYFERALLYAPKNREALAASAAHAFGNSGPSSHSPAWRIRSVSAFESAVSCLAFSPDSRYFAVGHGSSTRGMACVIEAATGKEVSKFETGTRITQVTFSPDGRYLATACDEFDQKGEVQLIETSTGKKVFEMAAELGVSSLCFSPNTRFFAMGCRDGTALIIETSSGKKVKTIKIDDDHVHTVLFSPDGGYFAAGRRTTVQVFETQKFKEITKCSFETNVVSACFSPNSRHLAVAGAEGSVWVLEVTTDKEIVSYNSGDSYASISIKIIFSPDGRHITTNGYSAIIVDATTGQKTGETSINTSARSASFSPDARHLALGCEDKTLRVVEVSTGKEIYQTEFGAAVTAVSFSPDGRYLAAASDDHTARVFEPATGREVGQTDIGNLAHVLSFSSDGRHLAMSNYDGPNAVTLHVLETESGKEVSGLKLKDPIVYADFSPDGHHLLLRSHNWNRDSNQSTSHVDLVNVESGKVVHSFESKLTAVAEFSPNGRYIAVVEEDINSGATLKILETTSWKELQTMDLEKPSAIAISPNGLYLAIGREATNDPENAFVQILETTSWKETLRLAHGAMVPLCFSPDSRSLAVKCRDDHLRVFDAATSAKVIEIETSIVGSLVAFSPNGRHLAVADREQTVRIYNTATGRELSSAAFADFSVIGITSLRFSQDNTRLLIGGYGPSVHAIDCTWLEADDETPSPWSSALQLQSGHRFQSNGKMTALSSVELLSAQKEVHLFCAAKPPPGQTWTHAILKWAQMPPEERTTSPWTTETIRIAIGRWIMQSEGFYLPTDLTLAAPWHPLVPLFLAPLEEQPDDKADTLTRKKMQVYPRFLARLTLKRLQDADEKLYGRDTLAEYATWSAKTIHEKLKLKPEALEALTFALERTPPEKQNELLKLKSEIEK